MIISSVCGKIFDYRGFLGNNCININDDGYIDSISKLPKSNKKYEYSNYIIAPGLIDLHVHLRGLDLSYKEDEETGTKSAVQSGFTLVVDMPNTKPKLNNRKSIELKLNELKNKSYTDYGVYSGVPSKIDDIEEIIDLPIAGFKIYPEDLGSKINIIKKLLNINKLVILHPELQEAEKINDLENFERGLVRGCHYESSAVDYLNSIDYEAKKIHITHASCPSTVYEAKKFNYTVDSTPHHIFYDSNNMGCYYRVNPPLRDRETKYSLFKLLIDGQIDAMCSDHAPHSDREKNNFITCPSGIPWLGLWPWLVFKLVTLGLISIDRFLFLLSYSPAKILGLSNYGYIDRNARADLIVIDKSMKWRFVETFSKAPYNMHFMEEMYGFPIKVFVGGKLVSDYRNIIDRPEPINPFAK